MPEPWIQLGNRALTLDTLPQAGRDLLKLGTGYAVWLLHGDMGSGKTTLVKHLIKELGIESQVTSPTYSIVNEYGLAGKRLVYHFDFYRLNNETEALDIGFEEYLTSGNLCLIEWPEKVKTLLPARYFDVKIQDVNSESREIYFRRND